MKRLRVAAALAFALASCASLCQTTPQNGGVEYLLTKGRSLNLIVSIQTGTLTHVLGQKLSLQVKTFVGAAVGTAGPFGGIEVGKASPLADQLSAWIGAALVLANVQSARFGLSIGLTWKF